MRGPQFAIQTQGCRGKKTKEKREKQKQERTERKTREKQKRAEKKERRGKKANHLGPQAKRPRSIPGFRLLRQLRQHRRLQLRHLKGGRLFWARLLGVGTPRMDFGLPFGVSCFDGRRVVFSFLAVGSPPPRKNRFCFPLPRKSQPRRCFFSGCGSPPPEKLGLFVAFLSLGGVLSFWSWCPFGAGFKRKKENPPFGRVHKKRHTPVASQEPTRKGFLKNRDPSPGVLFDSTSYWRLSGPLGRGSHLTPSEIMRCSSISLRAEHGCLLLNCL